MNPISICGSGRRRWLTFLWLAVVLLAEAGTGPLAFPGAEGFGRWASGGRGGEVVYVTNLNDAGEGTLRAALERKGARTVVFAVSGTIELESPLRIRHGDVTVAGQTAPGGGITLANYPLEIRRADNVIVRFLRVRMGDRSGQPLDALDVRQSKRVIIDHCSFSWGIDEVASAYDNEEFTLQWSFVTESLRESVHPKGKHGYGGIWGGRGASFHHNLLAHHDSRNPRFNGARYHRTEQELVDFRNNVIYNWGANSTYGGEPAPDGSKSRHNSINNYYKYGPATKENARSRVLEPSANKGHLGLFHVAGNFVHDDPTVTADNWNGGIHRVQAEQYAEIRALDPFPAEPVRTSDARQALDHVLALGGALLPHRDAVDARIAAEVAAGSATFSGSRSGLPGLIDSPQDVGGWPLLPAAPAPQDSDRDGIPDAWELAHGLDPLDPADANQIRDSSGYTLLETYLNGLASGAFP